MKKLLAVFSLAAISAMAANVTGYIIDQKCSSNKAMLGNVACATACIKHGSPAVLATEDGKIYNISNQDKVTAEAGKKVTVTGKLKGDTLTVASITEM